MTESITKSHRWSKSKEQLIPQSIQTQLVHVQHNPVPNARETSWVEEQHDYKDQEVCCEVVSPRNAREALPMIPQQYGYLNKI